MGKNRDRVSIVAAILEAVNSGANKTRIMFGANLSFKLLNKYLGVVVKAGFVRVDGSKFILTELGQEFLEQYKQFKERYVVIQQSFESLGNEKEKLNSMCEPSLSSTKLRSSNSLLQKI